MIKKLALMLVASVVLLVLAATPGAAPTTLRADLTVPFTSPPVVVGSVESSFPQSATVHLTGALANTGFVLTSQYWAGTATCNEPRAGGVMLTGSLQTDRSGNGVGQFLYPPLPAGISLVNWGVGHWIGPGPFDYAWDYWSNCVTVPVVTPASLCQLTLEYTHGSAKYQGLSTIQKAGFDRTVNALCEATLTRITPGISPAMKKLLVAGYKRGVTIFASGGWLTRAQAGELSGFADAL